jgi:hypothetical protein
MTSVTPKRLTITLIALTWLALAAPPAFSQFCCPVPTDEQTNNQGAPPNDTSTDYLMHINDGQGTIFNGRRINETGFGPDDCWYPGAPYDDTVYVDGSTWTVAGNNATGLTNYWGYDSVGFTPFGVSLIRRNGATLPCGYELTQDLWMDCEASEPFHFYRSDILSSTIYAAEVLDCRDANCNLVHQ